MHKTKILSFGSHEFNISLEELKEYLKFDLTCIQIKDSKKNLQNYDVLLIHENFLGNPIEEVEIVKKSSNIKILATSSTKTIPDYFNFKLGLPVNINELNLIIENFIAKKNFSDNSCISIKEYILDKNEKKLKRDQNFIFLTEKEIQLIELLLISGGSLNKDKILTDVWQYSDETDTHTVETHIYRLRKKINEKFSDEKFIINSKDGYSL